MNFGLRVILFLTGAIVVWLGLNVGLGGFETLGWQGAQGFFTVSDPMIRGGRGNSGQCLRWIA